MFEGTWVFAAQVHKALFATCCKCTDGHRLDEREGIALDDDAVFEGAGFAFVGVTHEVARAHRLSGDGGPLAAGWERCAAAPNEIRVGDFADDSGWAHRKRGAQRLVSAVGAVVVERRRIDHADPLEQYEFGCALGRGGLRHCCNNWGFGAEALWSDAQRNSNIGGDGWCNHGFVSGVAGFGNEYRWTTLA